MIISNFPGGGGAGSVKLSVLTASSLPATVEDGQIVIITDVLASQAYVDTDEPTKPSVGDIWVKISSGGIAALELTNKSPYLRNGLTEALQWNGNVWESRDGYMSVDGELIEFATAIPPVGTALNDMTWTQIATIARKGLGSTYFSVGDRKEMIINGKIGETEFVNVSVWAYILGFNHNSSIEGDNTIQFQIGMSAKNGGQSICVVSNKYWEGTSGAYFNANTSQTTSGGWQSSRLRNALLGNNGTPAAPTSGSFMAALGAELRSVMKPCTKYTDNKGATTYASNVTATTDYLWEPSEYEVFGKCTRSNATEATYQKQYEFFAAGNSAKKYDHKATTSPAAWWTRSVYAGNATNFCSVDTNGSAAASGANYSIGLAPCFCI